MANTHTFGNFTVSKSDGFFSLKDENSVKSCWGKKAEKAAAKFAKLIEGENDEQLKIWLVQKSCNGF